VKVFDLFILKGIKTIFSVGLAVFDSMQKHLLKMKDFGEIFVSFTTVPKRIKDAKRLFVLEKKHMV
jgi:hypothetical protein